MKSIFIALLGLSFSFASLAAVSEDQALTAFAGEYRFIDENTGERVIFTIDTNAKISMKDNDAYYESSSSISSISNGIGPGGLSILNVNLAGGSDEQEMTLNLRLVPIQNEEIKVQLLDMVYLENDGPNELSFVQKINKVKVEKKAADNSWQKI